MTYFRVPWIASLEHRSEGKLDNYHFWQFWKSRKKVNEVVFYVNFEPFLTRFCVLKAGQKSVFLGKKGIQKKGRDKVIFGQNTTF